MTNTQSYLEFSIRGTYCDLAMKIDGTLQTLIEVKSMARLKILTISNN